MSGGARVFRIAVAAIGLTVAGSGCTQVIVQEPAPAAVWRGHGPPPHAPAHGYRAKNQQDVQLMFDSRLGVYIVLDLPGVYFWSDVYYRQAKEGWERCDRLDGGWIAVADTSLPPGLRDKKAASRGKARGDGPASRAD
jgi:hypothetical protein